MAKQSDNETNMKAKTEKTEKAKKESSFDWKMFIRDLILVIIGSCFITYGLAAMGQVNIFSNGKMIQASLSIALLWVIILFFLLFTFTGFDRYKVVEYDDFTSLWMPVDKELPEKGLINPNTKDWQQYMCLVQVDENEGADIRPLSFNDTEKWINGSIDMTKYVLAWQKPPAAIQKIEDIYIPFDKEKNK